MNDFFSVFTYTPWDKLNKKTLTEVRLLSLKSVFDKYPVIEPEFFDDLSVNMSKNTHYSWFECIKRITGPDKEDYKIQNWIFIWGMDTDNRIYQFLLQKLENTKDSQAILVGLAPPELGRLFTEHKGDAILRTLSLLNTPKRLKFLLILKPKGLSLVEEQQLITLNKNDFEKIDFVKSLKNMPNIQGQWFFPHNPMCPVCKGLLVENMDYVKGYKKFVCPQCGYERKK
ncbi:MAG: hypothetical protein EU533_08295 [Promethearchaeota archaeon]|nr:MAG: hypothetical protein EU533_08295 [Candidatus Lokiarchaeota archaeon]